MPDNTVLNRAVQPDGDIIATDELAGGEKVQRVKIMLGADGENDGDVAGANRLPVTSPELQAIAGALGLIVELLEEIKMNTQTLSE